MKRFQITVDVLSTYTIFKDAEDAEEACDNVYEDGLDDVFSGDFLGEEILEITECSEVQFSKED